MLKLNTTKVGFAPKVVEHEKSEPRLDSLYRSTLVQSML
jgi:hypothetical protein